jgi:hypothetical protein
MMPNDQTTLVNFYTEYAPSRFRTASGEPVKRRTQQILAKRFRLPLIRAGHSVLIDPAQADERLRQAAEFQEPTGPRRGRPRAA